MNNIKKNGNVVLRLLIAGILAALCMGMGVALYGWLRGWQTAVQFSNGMFILGSAVIILGLLAIVGGFTSRGNFAITYSQSVSHASVAERTKQMMAELLRGYNVLWLSAMTGFTLIGVSILIYRFFG